MLTGLQLKNKMKDLSKEFWKAYQNRQYAKAKYIYLRCHTTALMAEFGQEWMEELFGRLAYIPEGDPLEEKERGDGLFPADMVEQVSTACIVHHLTTDELHLHPRDPARRG